MDTIQLSHVDEIYLDTYSAWNVQHYHIHRYTVNTYSTLFTICCYSVDRNENILQILLLQDIFVYLLQQIHSIQTWNENPDKLVISDMVY
jgi:hypothetical protein